MCTNIFFLHGKNNLTWIWSLTMVQTITKRNDENLTERGNGKEPTKLIFVLLSLFTIRLLRVFIDKIRLACNSIKYWNIKNAWVWENEKTRKNNRLTWNISLTRKSIEIRKIENTFPQFETIILKQCIIVKYSLETSKSFELDIKLETSGTELNKRWERWNIASTDHW